jgi:hypothetical protein
MSVMFQTLDRLQGQPKHTVSDSVAEALSFLQDSASGDVPYTASKFERAAKACTPEILSRFSGLTYNWKPTRLLEIRFGPQDPRTNPRTASTSDSALLWAAARRASRASA